VWPKTKRDRKHKKEKEGIESIYKTSARERINVYLTQQKQKRIESIYATPDIEVSKNRKYPLRHQKG
jgi:hypothetical protein